MKKIILTVLWLIFCIGTYAQNGKYAETNGVKIYYETYGSGEPLLLLHGFMGSHENWSTWIEDLSKEYQLIIHSNLAWQGLLDTFIKIFEVVLEQKNPSSNDYKANKEEWKEISGEYYLPAIRKKRNLNR